MTLGGLPVVPTVINTCKNKKVVNRRETALFRADEPIGVNNAVLTVHIKHDSNPVLCCVNRFEKGCWNSTYHA